jgi:mycobactin peptide synthetase MbtE
VNILVLRNDLSGNPTLRDLLRKAREMALAAYAHQDLPFDRMVDAVSPVRSLSRNPLFSVVVHVREELRAGQTIDGETTFTAVEPTFDVAHADLSLNFFAGNGYRGHVIYRPELYRRTTIERLARWLGRVLDAFADNPDQTLRDVQITDAEESQRIEGWSRGVTHVHVLDDLGQPVPVGVVGDVHYAGAAFDSELYRSGDRARWTEDGRLEFIGLIDEFASDATDVVTRPFEAPRTDTEQALAALLAEVLSVGEIGRYDDFFELGGDSILAVQLAARARDVGVGLTARMVFEHPSIHDLAAAVDERRDEAPEDGDTHHEPMTASGLSADELAAVTALWSSSQDGAP